MMMMMMGKVMIVVVDGIDMVVGCASSLDTSACENRRCSLADPVMFIT